MFGMIWSWYCGKRNVRVALSAGCSTLPARVKVHACVQISMKSLTDVLALVNHLLRISGIQLITDLSDGIPWISVDRNQIKQVILNLIHNALHAMPTGGELHMITDRRHREQRDWLTISLTDTGTGIAPENLRAGI